jgi:arsenite oxidase small subunit
MDWEVQIPMPQSANTDRRTLMLSAFALSGLSLCGRRAQASAPATYPKQRLSDLPTEAGGAVAFNYPGARDRCLLIRLAAPVPDGAGPKKDLVAFTALCPHKGFLLTYDPARRTLGPCGWHLSAFDPQQGGRMLQGQATQDLPRILLHAEGDALYAVGVTGLLYGTGNNQQDACGGEVP